MKLLKDFDKTAVLMRDYILQHYGGEFTDILYRETLQAYEELIPGIPHIVCGNSYCILLSHVCSVIQLSNLQL